MLGIFGFCEPKGFLNPLRAYKMNLISFYSVIVYVISYKDNSIFLKPQKMFF